MLLFDRMGPWPCIFALSAFFETSGREELSHRDWTIVVDCNITSYGKAVSSFDCDGLR